MTVASHKAAKGGVGFAVAVCLFMVAFAAGAQLDRRAAFSAASITCSFEDEQKMVDCISKHLPAIKWRTDYMSATSATFSVEVIYKNIKNTDGSVRKNFGSSFLVDKSKRYLVTAKHVLLGDNIDWPSRLTGHSFNDLETAIEDYLNSNVEIWVRPRAYSSGVKVMLVAIDRSADLALLQAESFDELALSSRPYFRALAMKDEYRCEGAIGGAVFAIGYTSAPPAPIVYSNAEIAGCSVRQKNAYLGGIKFRFTLYDTKSDFEEGMSGGPVIDDASLQVVGVVSGSAVGTSRKFFTPLSALKAFLSRF